MDEAIEVLRAALARSASGPQTGPDVRLALKTLRFCGIPTGECRYFWDAASGENQIGRSQMMNAALNRILLIRDGKLT